MKNYFRVVTRAQVLENVWGYDYCGSSNIVEVYIRYLRKKLATDGDRKLIHTVRGIGYILKEPNDSAACPPESALQPPKPLASPKPTPSKLSSSKLASPKSAITANTKHLAKPKRTTKRTSQRIEKRIVNR